MNNYHYYLKQSLKVPVGVQILQVVWDSESPLQVYLLTSDGHLLSKRFAFDILRSACLSASHPGTVAVIDGTDLKLTFFKYQNVPPPMSSLTLSLSAPASFVSFCPFDIGTKMAVTLNNGTAELFDTKGNSPSDLVKKPESVGLIQVPAHVRQLVWVHPLMLAGIQSMGDCDTVVLIHLADNAGQLSVSGIEPVEFAFTSLLLRLTVTHDLRLLCQDTEATVYQIAQDENGVPVVQQKAFFPKPCPWFASTYIGPERTEEVFIGLSERNTLYLEDKILSTDCTSFALHDQFLVMTTLAHTTCFISLDLSRNGEIQQSFVYMRLSYNELDFVLENRPPSPLDESIRRVEIGSKIVTVTPGDIRLVLQMPRGNLETINPRALVLSKICRALDASQFKDAFLACRKHRIDLNLLIDRNPQAFVSQIELALTQIDQPEYVNLLISGLKAEDVTKTMYASCHTEHASTGYEKNVNDCCNLIQNTLAKMDDKKYLLSILTAYAKKSPPDLGAAMSKILQVKRDSGAEAAENALRYLIFLADVNSLYDFALGVYDFPLVLMVAQHSQKDPREYLPFLNELQQLEKFYQRFVIDDHLSRFESALQNLNLAGEEHFEQCVSYIKKHDLYKFALTLFSPVEAKYHRVLEIYADELSSRGDAEESGILYSLAGKHELALEAYVKGLLWQEAFALAADMSLSEDKLKEMAFEMKGIHYM
jgi:elongator complex protein 1